MKSRLLIASVPRSAGLSIHMVSDFFLNSRPPLCGILRAKKLKSWMQPLGKFVTQLRAVSASVALARRPLSRLIVVPFVLCLLSSFARQQLDWCFHLHSSSSSLMIALLSQQQEQHQPDEFFACTAAAAAARLVLSLAEQQQ